MKCIFNIKSEIERKVSELQTEYFQMDEDERSEHLNFNITNYYFDSVNDFFITLSFMNDGKYIITLDTDCLIELIYDEIK